MPSRKYREDLDGPELARYFIYRIPKRVQTRPSISARRACTGSNSVYTGISILELLCPLRGDIRTASEEEEMKETNSG